MITEAIEDYQNIMDDLLQELTKFTQKQFNAVPFKDSWTAGQVAEHIIKFQSGLPELFAGNSAPANRGAEDKRQAIADIFLDFKAKYKSPEFIVPSGSEKDRDDSVAALKNLATVNIGAFNKHDATELCLNFEVPGMGPFTRLEWIWFLNYHTQRHIRQLENILVSV